MFHVAKKNPFFHFSIFMLFMFSHFFLVYNVSRFFFLFSLFHVFFIFGPVLSTELDHKVMLSKASTRPMFPNSTQYSLSIKVIPTSEFAKTRTSSARARQEIHRGPECVSIDQPASV